MAKSNKPPLHFVKSINGQHTLRGISNNKNSDIEEMSNKEIQSNARNRAGSVKVPISAIKKVNSYNLKSEDELLLQSISQNINEAIYRSIYGKGLVYINDAFVKMFGYKTEFEILNQSALNLYRNPEERKRISQEIIEKGSVTNREVEFKKKDGSIFYGSFSSNMVTGKDGVTYFDGAIRNITEEKITKNNLKYHSQMQEVLINISTQYINLPADTLDQAINKTLKDIGSFLSTDRIQIHTYDFQQSVCQTSYEWCDKGIPAVLQELTDTPLNLIMDMVSKHLQGENYFIENVDSLQEDLTKQALKSYGIKSVHTVPMVEENNCVGFISLDSLKHKRSYSSSEITMIRLFANMTVNVISRIRDQKRLHNLLETTVIQKKRLKDFSQITSHNIRTSVANLVAINNLLQEDAQASPYLEPLNVTTGKLNTSVYNLNSLLNFDTDNELLEKEPCDISSSIERVLNENGKVIKEKSIEVIISIPKQVFVEAFSSYLDSILQHLISNAIKHGTDSKSKKIKILVSTNENSVSVDIKDFGRGIDLKRYENKIFKAGVQLHADRCQGQGMGLFMAKYMAEAMGGTIRASSKPTKGTTFTLSFPVPR